MKILIALLIICITSIYYLNKKLYFIGRHQFDIYNELPFNITPVSTYENEGGVYFADGDGLSIIAAEENSWTDVGELNIKRIEGYGFSNQKFVCFVIDTANRRFSVEFTGDGNTKSPRELRVKILAGIQRTDLTLKQIHPNDESFSEVFLIRNYLNLLAFILIALILRLWITKSQKEKAKKLNTELP